MNLIEQDTCPTPNYCTIPLSRGMVALVDACDYAELSQYTWFACKTKKHGCYYTARKISKRASEHAGHHVYMHRQILGLAIGDRQTGDHITPSNTLDNRRSNLRIATVTQNSMNRGPNKNNTSGYKGVTKATCWKSQVKWMACITLEGKTKYLGTFDTAGAASQAYQRAAQSHFGEFSR